MSLKRFSINSSTVEFINVNYKFISPKNKILDNVKTENLKSIKFNNFDWVLQYQLFKMSSPLIRLHFFRTFKFLKRLSKPPKIVQMHSLCFQPKYEPSQVSPELDMNSQDLVYFMYWFLFIEHPDCFTSKFYLSINSSYTKVLYIRMSTKEDVLKSLDLAPNVEELRIQLYDKSIFAEIDDFEHFTKKLGEKLKMRYVLIYNIILPNGWEKSCIKNFMKLSDFQSLHISCLDSETHLPINVVDLHELIVKTNLKISCDRFVGLVKTPEFMEFFKVSEKYESTKFRFNEESYALKCGNECIPSPSPYFPSLSSLSNTKPISSIFKNQMQTTKTSPDETARASTSKTIPRRNRIPVFRKDKRKPKKKFGGKKW